MGFSKALDKNVSKGVLDLDDYSCWWLLEQLHELLKMTIYSEFIFFLKRLSGKVIGLWGLNW